MTVDKLSAQILKTMQKYTDNAKEAAKVETEKLAKEVSAKVQEAGGYEDVTGDYRAGFYIKEDGTRFTIANKEYQLTHLLEFGHIIKATGERTRAFPHWQQGQELAKELPKRIRRALKDAAKAKSGA